MIIKSISRSNKSFESLYTYLTRENEFSLDSFNLYSDPYNKQETTKEFLQNSHHLNNSRGKNYLYHEIISLNENNLSVTQQQEILKDLVQKYITLRAENHLVFSSCHTDKEHTHIHLMISANEIMGEKRVRLSKQEFSTIQKELEQYSNSIYPELGISQHYQKTKTLNKSKSKEQELKQRSKKLTKKEQVRDTLKELFSKAQSKTEFKKQIQDIKLEFYTRGETVGVIYNNKKYRLKNLGLEVEYNRMLNDFEIKENRKEKRSKQKEKSQKKSKEKSKKRDNKKESIIKKRRAEMKELRDSLEQELELQRSRWDDRFSSDPKIRKAWRKSQSNYQRFKNSREKGR